MAVHLTDTRAALGALRLPWCVDRITRTEELRIADEPHRIPEALQLRVRDVDDKRVRAMLGRQLAGDGNFSLSKIEAILSEARAAGCPPTIEDSAAFLIGEELSLIEGCHRTCATYLLDLQPAGPRRPHRDRRQGSGRPPLV
jgi:hypothetical protein